LAVITVLFAGIAFSAVADPKASLRETASWVVLVVAATWIAGLRPRVGLVGDEVVIVSIFRTRRFPLREVVGASPGYYGTELRLADGRTFTAGTVQRPNFAAWRGRESRADRVASIVLAAAAHERGEPPPAPPGAHRNAGDLPSGVTSGLGASISSLWASFWSR
jgi:hypothetical protein